MNIKDNKLIKILTINSGSSSIKYKLFNVNNSKNIKELYSGIIEQIGEKNSKIKNHETGLKLLINNLIQNKYINNLSEINAVGHRVVHGGNFLKSCIINSKIISKINKFSDLAPLHNPHNLKGIILLKKLMSKSKHIAIFDTSFHQTMPDYAYTYALPLNLIKKYGIRKYGFHGISHKYLSIRASELFKKPLHKLKLITCHIGNGCSISAIKNGKVIDTSMGFTPLEGLIMGTRAGDIDPGIILYLINQIKIDSKKLDFILNNESGLLGLSNYSKDMRDIKLEIKKKSKNAKLAFDVFSYRIKKYISSYYGILEGCDAIILSGGIFENHADLRKICCSFKSLDIKINNKINNISNKKEAILSDSKSKTKVIIIPTNEELMICKECLGLL